jgi:ATP/maltotriose-dependent transcriptional regulator MalT
LSATAGHQNRVRRERRIIERPRLIKLLDEAEQRTILLLAPAGYGKTTLARQWAKTLNRAIWITLTPAHRDVVTLAEDIADGIDALGGDAKAFIGEYLRGQANPQRAAREIGLVLAKRLDSARVQWIVFDDYHAIAPSEPAEQLFLTIRNRATPRLLVTSRTRPAWADGRAVIYGDNAEVRRDQLAMDESESAQVLRSRPASASLAERAAGWPAALALAAATDVPLPPGGSRSLPGALHRYLAEELFQAASEDLRAALLTVALVGQLPDPGLRQLLGGSFEEVVDEARALGFDSGDEGSFELHPLIREFLLDKVREETDSQERVRAAVELSLQEALWDNALDLVLRFRLMELVDPALTCAFKPLVRAGRLGTLMEFVTEVSSAPTFPPPSVEAAQAEMAYRDGQLELARELAERLLPELPARHPLRSRTAAILGHSSFLLADFAEAEAAFADARESAQDERDEGEALHGLALANVFGERPGAARAVGALGRRRHRSPTDLVRYATAQIAFRRFVHPHGLSGELHLETARLALGQVEDPRARSAVAYTVAGALAQRADYREAKTWLSVFFEDADKFGLEFALPYANWTAAQIALGLRRFAETERALQTVEDAAARSHDLHHELNARSLRARLLLQTGDTAGATACVAPPPPERLIPSWRGEYFATRALAFACAGEPDEAQMAAKQALRASRAPEIRLLAQAALSIATASTEAGVELIAAADRTNVWDPVVCALRSGRMLADALAKRDETRPKLERLYRRIDDQTLARRAGFRTRATRSPQELLSPREMEVLGLIARGYRNREISKALFIADSTTKIHVRHVLEKLGVRSRTEAAARLEMFS